jgi:Predicted transcriptional regulators
MTDLSEYGLTSYEARAYRALLDLGTATAQTLSARSEVPEGRIYDVLSNLENRGMVRAQTASRPKQFVAVEPTVAIDRLVDAEIHELEAEMEHYQSVADELKNELTADSTVEDRFWTTAIGTADALDLLFERIDAASSEIVMIADSVPRPLDLDEVGPDLLDRLAQAIERGVDVFLLVSERIVAETPRGLLDRLGTDPFGAENFSVRTTEPLHGSLYLLDRAELCFPVVSPIERDRILGLINLKDPAFAGQIESQFHEHWESSTIVDS